MKLLLVHSFLFTIRFFYPTNAEHKIQNGDIVVAEDTQKIDASLVVVLSLSLSPYEPN